MSGASALGLVAVAWQPVPPMQDGDRADLPVDPTVRSLSSIAGTNTRMPVFSASELRKGTLVYSSDSAEWQLA